MKTDLIRQPLTTIAVFAPPPLTCRFQVARFSLLSVMIWAWVFSWVARGQTTDAYFARLMPTGHADNVIEKGVLVVRDGKIIAVGDENETDIPTDANQHRLPGMTLVPGMVIAQTGLIDQRDINYTLTPDVLALDGFDFSADRNSLLAAGITTVQISPAGNRLLPGVTGVVKLTGPTVEMSEQEIVLNPRESLRIVLDSSSRNVPTIFEPPIGPVSIERPLEPTRPQVSLTLSSSLAALRSIFRQATASETFASLDEDKVLPNVAQFLQHSRLVRVSAETEAEIRGALNLAHQFDLELILVNSTSPRLLDLIEQHRNSDKLPRIRGFVFSVPRPGSIGAVTQESLDQAVQRKKMMAQLVKDGWNVAFTTSSDGDLRDIAYAMADFSGLSDQVHLTHAAAKILGVSDRVGSLSPGKDADFVALPTTTSLAQPLPQMTFVNGRKVFDRNPQPTATIVSAKEIYTGDGHVIKDAAIVVKGHTIRSLSSDFSAPLDALRYEFPDAVIVPGFVDLGATLGTGSSITGNIPLNSDLFKQLYPDDPAIKLARQQGVTTALIGSMNSTQPTPLFAIKLGDQPRVIKAPAAVRFSIGSNAAASATSLKTVLTRAKQYVDSWHKYEQDLAEYETKKAELEKQQAEEKQAAEKSEEEKKAEEQKQAESTESTGSSATRQGQRPRVVGPRPGAGRSPAPATDDKPKSDEPETGDEKTEEKPDEKKQEEQSKPEEKKLEPPKEPAKRPELEPYKDLFAGNIPAFVEARTPEAIEEAIKLFRDEFDLPTVLCGADGLARFPELLKDKQVKIVAGPDLILDLATPQQPTRRANLAEVLVNEGFVTGFQSKSAAGVARLPAAVQFAINQGLGFHDGLKGLTRNSAQILGQDNTTGCIQVGSDADLVVLSGPPFHSSTEVLAVMIDGSWVYLREDQK